MKAATKELARVLRKEKRLSLLEISNQLQISKGTASVWLRDLPLSAEELTARWRRKSGYRQKRTIRQLGEECDHHRVLPRCMSVSHKGRIAEAAILFRLSLHGFTVFKPVFDGAVEDFVIRNSVGRFIRIQVKWATQRRRGLPNISLRHSNGRRRFKPYSTDEIDAVVGYDAFADVAYVFTKQELVNTSTIAISSLHAERWDKLQGV